MKNAFLSKPIVVLIVGCLPLAALTVASFAGIGDLDSDLPSIGEEDLISAGASHFVPSAEQLADDDSLREEISEREFLAGEPLSDRAKSADPIYLASLASDWRHWSDATSLADEILAVEETLRKVESTRFDSTDAKRAQLEAARDRMVAIQETCQNEAPAGNDRLAPVLQRRLDDLDARIDRLKRQERAEEKIRQAELAFQAGRYDDSVKLYEQVLEQYSDVIVTEAVRKDFQRAGFWKEMRYLRLTTPVTDDPSTQHELLVNFLNKYQGIEGDTEQQRLAEVTGKLEMIRNELQRLEMNRAAQAPIARLEVYDTRPFTEGLAAAARIAEQYPTNWVRSQLQQQVIAWLNEELPSKQLEEPPDIEEVETMSGTVLRGFFEPVGDASGGVIGYKNYPSAEERENPTRNVGRYPAADLRGVPNLSVPRQCVDAYTTARNELLADGGNLDRWRSLRRTCESAEAALIDYRRKPGSSRTSLSFLETIQFTKDVVTPEVWAHIQAIWPE